MFFQVKRQKTIEIVYTMAICMQQGLNNNVVLTPKSISNFEIVLQSYLV